MTTIAIGKVLIANPPMNPNLQHLQPDDFPVGIEEAITFGGAFSDRILGDLSCFD